jgi:pimeloyl-ACP methyl ester carboxylesterase
MMNWLILPASLLAAFALYTHVGERRAEKAFPPIGEQAKVEGLNVHFIEAGSGSPVVLIHGASTSLLDFHASIFEPLSVEHRVIAVDRPGHGYSDRPAGEWPNPAEQARLIRGLLRDLDVQDPVLVGHSWSGSVVLAYLLDYPEHAAGGVLLAGGSHPWEGGVAWYNELAGVPVLGRLFARTLVCPFGRLSLETAVHSVFAPNPVPPDYERRTGLPLSLRPGVFLSNAEDIRLLSGFLDSQSRRYADIRHPLLLVTGDEDQIVPAWNHADRLIQQAPAAELVVLEETGHGLHHTHSNRITDLISSFARRLASSNGPVGPSGGALAQGPTKRLSPLD